MTFLVHWVPALVAGFVLLAAGLVLEALIRAEDRVARPKRELGVGGGD